MTEDEYEALERFAIMSEQPDVSEIDALRYVQKQYGREIAVKIWEKCCNH
jgi:hypothetical protein